MLKGLIAEALTLPEELERFLLEAGEVKARLAKVEEARKAREIEALKHAASNGKNEAERKAAMASFLASDPEYQHLSQEERRAKARLQELEAAVEVVKARVKLTRELLHLAAKAIEANHKEALEAFGLEVTEPRQEAKKNGVWEADWTWVRGEVTGVERGKKEGVVKVRITTPEGNEREVYANNSLADKFKAKLGEKVAVKAKKLDSGNLLAVAVD
ncbi:hypothetical protein Adeg_1996 [Ammonifex degensii KC4]|uniref:Uncharacterized protein n=1 Tax=Ammonifex degensii (strain DSM 10501 / KC4) TaxID=429009 RepID=C9R9U5_AMMDK|nr:hypothetical protein [Ammonifex degensii]ACX53074.1 hypothetical protein Adeg_1996 [Ammonifex degensii KC4]